MRRTSFALTAIFATMMRAHAEPACPWLTQGTAAAILGAPVQASVTVAPAGEGSCLFVAGQGAKMDSLEITVTSAEHDPCKQQGKKLPGIGNEAVECKPLPSNGERAGIISSRVRATYFTVKLKLQQSAHPGSETRTEESLREVAEQVAGSLD